MFFEVLNLFYITQFFLKYYFYEPLQGISVTPLGTFVASGGTLFFTSTFVYQLKIFPPWNQSINYFSFNYLQSIRNVSNKFRSLIGFLWVKWNDMFTVPAPLLSQAFKFFVCGILTIVMVMASKLVFTTQ